MGLTDEQIANLTNELADALVSAFPDREKLEFVVGRVLQMKINKITQGEQLFETTAGRVVSWAESNGRIADLVIGASFQNPGNVQLQQFARNNLGTLLCLEFNTLLDASLLLSLAEALQAIAHTQTFLESVFVACSCTLDDPAVGAPELRQQLDSDVSSSVKLLVLLDLFLRQWERSHNECLYIALFVYHLSFSVIGTAQSRLKAWLASLPLSLQLPSDVVSSAANLERPPEDALKTLLASFIVLVEPLETSDSGHYMVSGYIVTRLGENDNDPYFEKITLLQLPADVNDSGAAKTGHTIQEIESCFPDWLTQASEAIGSRSIDIQTTYGLELPPAQDITVEFWLPFELLSDTVETWKIYRKPLRLKRLGRLLSSSEYKILVRSYDRLVDSESLNALIKTWQDVVLPSQQLPHSGASMPVSYRFDGWQHQPALQEQIKTSVMGLSTTCTICDQQYESHREDLFIWMLDKGVPLVIWSRDLGLTDPDKSILAQEMEDWVSAASPARLTPLFENVYQARRRASNNLLALWCDEPKRVVELKQFRKEGRLQA